MSQSQTCPECPENSLSTKCQLPGNRGLLGETTKRPRVTLKEVERSTGQMIRSHCLHQLHSLYNISHLFTGVSVMRYSVLLSSSVTGFNINTDQSIYIEI